MPTLVPFTAKDFATLAAWFASEAEVVRWGGPAVRHPLDAAQLQAMLDEGSGERPARLAWSAMEDGAVVGHVQLGLDRRHGNATLSRVAIAPAARGRGLAAPMLELVLEEAFERLGMERVELSVYTFNAPAIRTYERLGFVREGVRRSSVRIGDERWDTAIMALIRGEYLERGSDRPPPVAAPA